MRLQVEQLEKERRELNEKMRVATKRLDHTERAYRKQERPLLSKDYEIQQANDQAAHEATQISRIENYRIAHQQDLETKARLSRMLPDYNARRQEIVGKRSEEFTKKQQVAQMKIEEEKVKRRAQVLQKREEERLRNEEEERTRREQEEEEERLEEERRREEEGVYTCSPSLDASYSDCSLNNPERLAAEEQARAEEEEKKRLEQEKLTKIREERERERQEAAEKARLQTQREEEALNRAQLRREEEKLKERRAYVPPAASIRTVEGEGAWRRPGGTTPSRPSVPLPPVRSESPATAPVAKFRPGGSAGSGWRAREAAKQAEPTTNGPSRPSTPASRPPATEESNDDGFQPARNVWRPSRGRGITRG